MLGQAHTLKNTEDDVSAITSKSEPTNRPSYLQRTTWFGLSAIACILVLCFGGVHESTYLSTYLVTFLLTMFVAVSVPTNKDACFQRGTISKQVLVILSILVGYCCVQYIVFSLISIEHPVLGSYSKLVNSQKFFTTLLGIVFFSSMYYLSRNFLAFSQRNELRAVSFLNALGFSVSLIALAHWFYDNGKLFWYYAPENVFITNRARWPFVNPNHLACFLLPIVFLAIGYISNLGLELGALFKSLKERNGEKYLLETLLTSRRARKHLFMIFALALVLLSVCLAIAGSLSRSAWLGGSLGLAVFLVIDQLIIRIKEPNSDSDTRLGPRESKLEPDDIFPALNARRRRKNKRIGETDTAARMFSKIFSVMGLLYKPLILLVASVIFYLFLMGRGLELFEERVDYGLTSAKDDIRWQLYKDSFPMILENPLMGVGLGQWSQVYPRHMNASLSGVNPIYLHSEPLSAVVELGLLGSLPIAVLAFLLIFAFVKSLKSLDLQGRYFLLAYACAVFSLSVASVLEFPFRIPAICCVFAYLLALLTHRIDAALAKNSLEPNKHAPES